MMFVSFLVNTSGSRRLRRHRVEASRDVGGSGHYLLRSSACERIRVSRYFDDVACSLAETANARTSGFSIKQDDSLDFGTILFLETIWHMPYK